MSHTEYSAQFVQYSSVFLGLEKAGTHPRNCAEHSRLQLHPPVVGAIP